MKNTLAIPPRPKAGQAGQKLTASVTKIPTSKKPQAGQFNNNDAITDVAAGAASSVLPLLHRQHPMHLSDLGQTFWFPRPIPCWSLLLLLLLLHTLVAPLHLDVVLAAWRSKAWHLVEVQEEVQKAGA